ncbi:N-acetyltransferase family protein [Roseateles chitinivorans]|uniref:GNAT family N-acetyltransferase n=1 Tax=Roseateles chitinivorans TaxID=2917965 RepID=UPI003D67F478
MQIRFYQQDDFNSLLDLLVDMSIHYNGTNASAREVIAQHLKDRILGPDSDVRLVVAEASGVVMGMAAISLLYPAPKERGQLFMKELYVHGAHRGMNVGEHLMRWIARLAVEKNCMRFDWTVDADNTGALSFYQRLQAEHVSSKLYFRLSGASLDDLAQDPVATPVP